MITNSLTISSVTVLLLYILLFTVQEYSIAAPDGFTLFVNNSPTQSGNPVLVSSGSAVYFEIQQSSNLPIHFDPTGKGDISYSLNGNLAQFATAYNAGKYNPIIRVGDRMTQLQLIVDQEQVDWAGWGKLILSFISQISWSLLVLIVFTVLLSWKGFRTLVLSMKPTKVRIGGFAMEASDLSSRMTAALDNAVSTIERKLPPQTAVRLLPSSLSSDMAYHVHLLEFIHEMGAHPGNVNAWNAAGNYYFAHDSTKAEAAYNRAIELDNNDPSAYANLGRLSLIRHDDIHAARQYYTTALKLADKRHTTCVAAHLGMVTVLSRSSYNEEDKENEKLHCEQAKNILQRSVSLDKTDFWSLLFLGWCWSYGDPDYTKAIEYASRALK